MSRLKAELDQSRGRTAELEKSSTEEKQLRDEETRKLKESLEEFESRTTVAERELEALKIKIARWLAEFTTINGQLDSKLFSLFLLTRHSSFYLHITYLDVSSYQFRELPPFQSSCG